MRNAIRKGKVVLPSLAAAALAGWIGVPAVHGDFTLTVVKGSSSNATDTDWELEATNTGTNGTGTALVGYDVAVTMTNTNKYFVIDTSADIDGDGATVMNDSGNYLDANISDTPDDYYGTKTPSFNTLTGTFMTLPSTKSVKASSSYAIVDDVFINSQTQAFTPTGNSATWHTFNSQSSTSSAIDPQFFTGIYSLEMVVASTSGGSNASGTFGPLPFANIVVPTGQTFTVQGQLGGNSGNAFTFPTTVVGGAVTSGGSTISLSLTNTTPATGTLIANVTMHGSSTLGYPLQNFAVAGGAQSNGYVAVTGFNPATDVEIYGLEANGATSLASLISALQAAVNAGGVVEAPTGSAGALLTAAGDNIEVVFTNVTDTAFMSYNLSGYTGNGTVTISQVSVIPEPTGIGLLVAGGLGLLGRRRRKSLS